MDTIQEDKSRPNRTNMTRRTNRQTRGSIELQKMELTHDERTVYLSSPLTSRPRREKEVVEKVSKDGEAVSEEEESEESSSNEESDDNFNPTDSDEDSDN